MDATDDLGESVLHAAVRAGHQKVVGKLIEARASDPNALNHLKQTALHILARYPKGSAVAILTQLQPLMQDINAQDAQGNTPIFYAYSGGAAELSAALVAQGGHLGLPNKQGLSVYC